MNRRAFLSRLGTGTCLAAMAEARLLADEEAELKRRAAAYWRQLREKVFPYWHTVAVDWKRGGFLLGSGAGGRAPLKQLVTQSRMIWAFSTAHRLGFSDSRRDYLQAADLGYRFLTGKMLDPVYGGYYWKTDAEGGAVNSRKFLYGEAFAVYGLVAYFRAGGPEPALEQALELWRTIERHCHDAKRGGWGEHYERDWRFLARQDPEIEVEVAGWKSANAHLHWMEALAELYEATRDPGVRESLEEALEINRRWFYPAEAGQSVLWRLPDWRPVPNPPKKTVSYGHNVEFAWLMLRAQRVLGKPLDWPWFFSIIEHAYRRGYDRARGGLFSAGMDDEPASDRTKVWWVQAEWIAALTEAVDRRPEEKYRRALLRTFDFLDAWQIDPKDGIWRDTLNEDGSPKNPAKAHLWKGAYHDVRALVKFSLRRIPKKPSGRLDDLL
ncbi:MAG: AGE family epimerase/isomerase [Verrucomicrobia bacterium]|nr:AGE family epimerase/isomerase [Verrucomicrobiota bacterium]